MKYFVILLMSISGAAHASTITVDFDGIALGTGAGSLETQGYIFESTNGVNGCNGNNCLFSQSDMPFDTTQVLFRKADNGAFSLESLEVVFGDRVFGQTTSGETIYSESFSFGFREVFVGDASWSSMEWVAVSYTDPDGFFGASIDNVWVSAVPVPAAVWLFGSALAGLGWMRRKQTV